jgi:hypothetical protein
VGARGGGLSARKVRRSRGWLDLKTNYLLVFRYLNGAVSEMLLCFECGFEHFGRGRAAGIERVWEGLSPFGEHAWDSR